MPNLSKISHPEGGCRYGNLLRHGPRPHERTPKFFSWVSEVLEMESKVTEMNPSDEIQIRTQSSDYSFRMTDPLQCRGLLRGGRLGMDQHEAIFVEMIRPMDNAMPLSDQLEPGDRAVFLVGGNGLKKLTTSTITEIVCSETSEPPLDDC